MMQVHKLTRLDELKVWWELTGELQFDVLTYYGVCAAVGYLQGYLIGAQIVGWL